MALVVALVVVLLVGGALALAASSLNLRMRTVREEARTVRLTALTDAAVATTLAELAASWSYSGLTTTAYGEGTIASEVRSLDTDRCTVEARASYGGRRRTVQVTVTRTPHGLEIRDWKRLPEGGGGG